MRNSTCRLTDASTSMTPHLVEWHRSAPSLQCRDIIDERALTAAANTAASPCTPLHSAAVSFRCKLGKFPRWLKWSMVKVQLIVFLRVSKRETPTAALAAPPLRCHWPGGAAVPHRCLPERSRSDGEKRSDRSEAKCKINSDEIWSSPI